MQRIVEIEQPLHHAVDARIAPALPIVAAEHRQREDNAHLQQPIDHVDGKAIDHGVDRHIDDQPESLLFQIAPVRAERQHTERRNAAPVAGEADYADQNNEQRLEPVDDFVTVCYPQHHKTPRERPHHARLVEQTAIVERDERMPVDKVVRGIEIAKVRKKCKKEQPRGIFADIMRIMEAFGDEIAHNRAGDAADEVHQQRQRRARIAGEDSPRNVIDRHGQNGDQLDRVGV